MEFSISSSIVTSTEVTRCSDPCTSISNTFLFKKGDTWKGTYIYSTATSTEPVLQSTPDILQLVIKDVIFSLNNSTRKQSLVVELSFENLTQSTVAVGYFNRCTQSGKILEIPNLSLQESLGQTDFTISQNGYELGIDFLEVDKDDSGIETLVVYSAQLFKQN